jgi:cyanophycin synthetase
VLTDPTVEAAVLETARGGMMRRGLGYDWTDVGVITNVTGDHLGQDGLATVEDIADVKALVAERVRDGGTLVLNADDPRVRQMVNRSAVRASGKRLVWFSLDTHAPVVQQHLRAGGTAYLADGGQLVEATGEQRIPVLDAADVPGVWAGDAPDSGSGTAGYAAANALAAIAAAVCMGVPREAMPRLMKDFGMGDNPGRGMLFRRGDIHIAVDYAHNPAAIAAVTGALHRRWGSEHCVAAVTLPGDRRDDVVTDSARVLAEGYGRVVCYEDQDTRGREPGELRGLLVEAVTAHRPDTRCETATTLAEAVDKALAMTRPGEVLLLLYEKLEPVLALLDSLGAAAAVPASTVAATTSSAGDAA